MNRREHPVFFDHSGKRWKRSRTFFRVLLLTVFVVAAVFSLTLVAVPLAPLKVSSHNYISKFVPRIQNHEEAARSFIAHKTSQALKSEVEREERIKHAMHPRSSGKPLSTVVGYYVSWDDSSFESLRRHIDSLTYVMPEWFFLKSDIKHIKKGELAFDSPVRGKDINDKALIRLTQRHNVPLIPMIENFDYHTGKQMWSWHALRNLLIDRDYQEQLAEDLRDYLVDARKSGVKCAGINIDLEPPAFGQMPEPQRSAAVKLVHDELPHFVGTVRRVFKPAHLMVTQDLPVNAPDSQGQYLHPEINYEKLGDLNDLVVVMFYDEHGQGSLQSGPIAGVDWVEKCADCIFSEMDSKKVILGLGDYALDWTAQSWSDNGDAISKAGAHQLSFADALELARETNSSMEMAYPDLNPHFYYSDTAGDHVVYIMDAIATHNTVTALKDYEPGGVAVWRLGPEDPGIWSFICANKLTKRMKTCDLRKVYMESTITNRGTGELIQVVNHSPDGRRKLSLDNHGLITAEKYVSYPSPYIIQHFGDAGKRIALTFDDGPDPKYTPRILKVLKRYHVPATFFVIGEAAESHSDIVRDCWLQGCDIGNHTFYHPHILEISPIRIELELNATQRVIESIIGRSTRLFRPPFGDSADSNVGSAEDATMLVKTENLGYVTVGMNIDPKDYERPGVGKIARGVTDQLGITSKAPASANLISHNIILLHDGGGNRDQTIAALPHIIRELKADGYQFVTVSNLLGKSGHTRFFPPLQHRDAAITGVDRMVFESSFLVSRVLQIAFLAFIVLGVLRMLLVTPLAIFQTRSGKSSGNESFTPPVTVIIPAYNEENVVCRTIRTVLDSNYPDFSVIVVDDGSTDGTAEAVRSEFSSEKRVTFICKENGGKASALNIGVSMAQTEIVVCLDADTIFARDTIRHLVRQFEDPQVGAVAGNVKVGNRKNMLTIWQSIEYITSQNFDRRAYAALNSVAVVPGAVGAWRKSAIIEAGGYEHDTLAEDTDLTFRVRLLGYHVRAENDALAYTEAPDTVKTLAKQRFRWAFGILQSLWKHRQALFNPDYGALSCFVMPSMWVYNVFLQVFSPLVDLTVLLALFSGQSIIVLSYYAAFFAIDMFAALIAVRLDNEDWRLLWWLLIQRIFYRQFMYCVIISSILAALRGGVVGWGKLQRKATVTLPETTACGPKSDV